MAQQILLCVEADSKSKSDWIYIKGFIHHFYCPDRNDKLLSIFMGGKSKYCSRSVTAEISSRKRIWKNGLTHVIICIDTDEMFQNPVFAAEFRKIISFCNEHQYELVWFCRDIEEVFVGKRISNTEKKSCAHSFRTGNRVSSLKPTDFQAEQPSIGRSNLSIILNRYFEKKDSK
ncbi:MAG: hypothetical protein VZT48_03410 [Bulleidia sp.]|nr:hypothetical protein [Bulleidia sp.]